MANPVIFILDDETQVLNAIERDLRQKYAKDYRIIKAASGKEALQLVEKLKQRNDQVALFLVDQRMPEMGGTEFLSKSKEIYPVSKKALLTAYADTNAAISAINEVGLDYYFMKPWSPPELNLYPVLNDLLGDWQATAERPFEGIRVAGTLWSANSHRIKDFLSRSQIPYQWLDIEINAEAMKMVEAVNQGKHSLPIIFFPDGSVLINPDITTLAEKVGLNTIAKQPFYDLIIIGAGPAGLSSAVYGASEGLKTLLIDKETTGGQAGTSSLIENYLGFPNGLSGADLARRATAQAARLGAEILTAQEVKSIRIEDPYRLVKLANGTELSCKALIIATGASWRTLDLAGIDKLTGAGVYYGAALSEAAHYKNKNIFIVGGANSAGQAAMFFSRFASKVTILVRGDSLEKGMSQYLVDQIYETKNIEVKLHSDVTEIMGNDKLESITFKDSVNGRTITIPAAALFIFIGAQPHSELVADIVQRNRAGFILTGQDINNNGDASIRWPLKRDPFLLETSLPGIFAVGDVRQNDVKRVASAVGQGSTAVSFVHQYLKTV